ncbi:MAG: exonuclease SbcCD subunit D [Halarsenatibacteraceae bacterium]
MKDRLRFLHTADLHLGRPLKSASQVPDYLEQVFNDAGFKALRNIVTQVIDRDLDFVVISGDLYDSEARSIKASRIFLEECRRLAAHNKPVYIISGNHDPGGDKLEPFEYPDNVYFFDSEEVELKEYQGDAEQGDTEQGDAELTLARILGQSYRSNSDSRKMYTYYTVPDKNLFNLGLIHTQLNPDNRRYVPISKAELMEKDDIHYWALGHIHQPLVLNTSSPAVVYSGTPQGHNISEVGVKGCFIVEAEPGDPGENIKLEFIPTSPVIYKKIEVDISDLSRNLRRLSDLEELLLEKAEEQLDNNLFTEIDFYGMENENVSTAGEVNYEGVIIRWLITGRSSLHERIADNLAEAETEVKAYLNKQLAAKGMEPFVWTHSVQLRTSRELPDLEEIRENEIYQAVARVIQDLSEDSELEAELLSEWGSIWEGSEDHENRDNDSFYPDLETKQEIIEAAQEKIIAYLFAGGDGQ